MEDTKNILSYKTISYFGGVSLLVNSMTGPALIVIPAIISQSGWVTPTILTIIMWFISIFASLILCECISLIPGNNNFQGRIELTGLVKFHFGKIFYFIILSILNICLLSLNIASIIATSQSLDFAILKLIGHSCGLEFYPSVKFLCINTPVHNHVTPFGDEIRIISIGIIIVLLLIVPLGYINLNNNIFVQEIAFLSIIFIVILWTIDFIRIGILGNGFFTEWTNIDDQKQVLGAVMFNFVVAVAIPSWVNEKKLNVNPRIVIFLSITIAGFLFLYTGILGSNAFIYPNNMTFLTAIINCKKCFILSIISAYFLPCAVFLTSVPVYSIIVKYNLIENKICGKVMAFFISVIVPWLIAVPFYTGSGLIQVINWASLFLQSSINFLLPIIIYIKVKRNSLKNNYKPILEEEEDSSEYIVNNIEKNNNLSYFRAIPDWINGIYISIIIFTIIVILVIFTTILNF
jgi:hypothetical protein